MDTIMHIARRVGWEQARTAGEYRSDTLATEGFIHCSTSRQVASTANRHYRGEHGLVLLVIDAARVHAEIRYEEATGGERFPHIYGPLNADAVVEVLDFEPRADGTFAAPRAGSKARARHDS